MQEFIIKYRVQQALLALANGHLAANQASTSDAFVAFTAAPAAAAPCDSVLTFTPLLCCIAGAGSKAGPEPARSVPSQRGPVSLAGQGGGVPARPPARMPARH